MDGRLPCRLSYWQAAGSVDHINHMLLRPPGLLHGSTITSTATLFCLDCASLLIRTRRCNHLLAPGNKLVCSSTRVSTLRYVPLPAREPVPCPRKYRFLSPLPAPANTHPCQYDACLTTQGKFHGPAYRRTHPILRLCMWVSAIADRIVAARRGSRLGPGSTF